MSVDSCYRRDFDGLWHLVSVRCNRKWARDLAEPCFSCERRQSCRVSNKDIRWRPRYISKTYIDEASDGQ